MIIESRPDMYAELTVIDYPKSGTVKIAGQKVYCNTAYNHVVVVALKRKNEQGEPELVGLLRDDGDISYPLDINDEFSEHYHVRFSDDRRRKAIRKAKNAWYKFRNHQIERIPLN
jgi:hypothetical protein